MNKQIKVSGALASFTVFLSFIAITGCGGSSTTRGSTNELSSAFPSDLAVSSITESSTSSLVMALFGSKSQTTTVTQEGFIDKKEDIANLVEFKDEATFKAELTEMKDEINIFASAPGSTCYGPSITFSNHPDAPAGQIDADTTDNGPNDDDGQLPGGDLGIWSATEASTGETCCVAKMNNIIGEFEALMNAGTKTIAATLGAASLETSLADLPTAGATVDMKSQVNEVMDSNSIPLEFQTASLAREETNTSDGDPVFVTSLTEDITAGGKTVTMEATLEHIPMGESSTSSLKNQESSTTISNDTYCGTLKQAVNIAAADLPALGNCTGSDGVTRCTLVDYCKTSDTSMTYHLRTAEFCGQNKECGTVDPSDKKSASNTDGWGNNFYYTICNVNPEDGTGSCTQAWQAGPDDGNTRVLNVVVKSDDTGRCYFGFGPDVAASSGVGSIDRMICNWAAPGQSHTGVSKAQRQLFSKNSSGVFTPTSSNITYAPTNSCNKLTTQTTFSYDGSAAGAAVTNDLINLTDVDFTVPSLPDVPD